MRVMGPNGIGVIDTHTPLNTTFVPGMPPAGHIAFLSQSGALCGGIIDWTIGRGIGFSRLLSVGNEADVNETDVLPVLAADDISRVITLYLEDVKGGPAFVDALRAAAAMKPVLAIKTGRTASGQAATASHTGALAGVHAAFQGGVQADRRHRGGEHRGPVQRRPGVGLPAAARRQPDRDPDQCRRAGGAGRGCARGGRAAPGAHHPRFRSAIRSFLRRMPRWPGRWTCSAGPARVNYRQALEAVLADPIRDGVGDPGADDAEQAIRNRAAVDAAVEAFGRPPHAAGKPVLACLMGEASLTAAFQAARPDRNPGLHLPGRRSGEHSVRYGSGRGGSQVRPIRPTGKP